MELKEFNQTIEHLRQFFDACVFELRTKNMETETILTVKDEKSNADLVEIHFNNDININSHNGYDSLGLFVSYDWANYDENDLSQAELSAVKAIIKMFRNK